jgi:phosphonate degradation associated HDIG domain protein
VRPAAARAAAVPRRSDDPAAFAAALLAWLERAGDARYDEAVTQAEHMLQSAALAAARGLPPAAVAAALLHDVGHLLAGEDAVRDRDARHEEVGARWLARSFGPEVAEPVRLHVAAKRWLCATDPAYRGGLSPASERSLALQGGPMTPAEAEAFAALPSAAMAVALRCIDDEAKVPGLRVPPASAYLGLVAGLVRR